MAKESNFGLIVDGVRQPIYITSNLDFGGKQQVVIYESPGTNGGVIITTGRTSKTTTLTGKMIVDDPADLPDLREKWENIRDSAKVVTLINPLGDGPDTGRYIIEEFSGSLPEGQERYFDFTMVLREHRQTNLKRSVVNLIAFEDKEDFINTFNEQLSIVQQANL